MEYLAHNAVLQELRWGNIVENWLFYGNVDGVMTIRYLTLGSSKAGDSLVMTIWECEDVGNHDFIDIYSFPESDPDYEPIIFEFDNYDDVFQKVTEMGGDISKFTKQFGLQYYYKMIKTAV